MRSTVYRVVDVATSELHRKGIPWEGRSPCEAKAQVGSSEAQVDLLQTPYPVADAESNEEATAER